MQTKFGAHGECALSVESNILIIDITGPCNVEFFDELHVDLIETAKKIDIENYAALLILRGEAIFVDDAFEYHVAFLQKARTKAIAINLEHCYTPSATQIMCDKAYNKAGIIHQFFNTNIDAKNWLLTEILNR